jgi:hypothetical protein
MRQNFKSQPSPLGRGWTAAGAFAFPSRSGPGEGALGPKLRKSYL